MDVASDTTSAVAASSGDGGETKSDGSPKPVTTEVENDSFFYLIYYLKKYK